MSYRFMVDDTRLELAGAGRCASGIRCISAAQARLKQPSAVSSQVRGSVLHKQKTTLFSVVFMVDDTRLELVTSRTSSGCATSCANRPSLKNR